MYVCAYVCYFLLPKEVVIWLVDLGLFCSQSGLLEVWKAFWISLGYNKSEVSSRLRLPGVLRSLFTLLKSGGGE